MSIPISIGTGAASVAAEAVSGLQYQRIQAVGPGGVSVMGVNPDNTINVSVVGILAPALIEDAGNEGDDSSPQAGLLQPSGSSAQWPIGGAMHVFNRTDLGWDRLTGNSSVGAYVHLTSSIVAVNRGSIISVSQGSVITVAQGSIAAAIVSGSIISVPSGSVITVAQGSVAAAIVSGSVHAIVSGSVVAAGNQSVSGTVGASIIGWVPTQPSNTSVITVLQSSSIIARVTGSVVALPASGSVIANATITSIATSNGGLPVYAQLSRYVQGTADMRVVLGTSVIALAAPGANIRYYITNVQVANFGSASVLVKISDTATSTLGWTIAPAGGGSNFQPFYRAAANTPITASLNGTASVLVSMQGFTSDI